ncbi:MAG: stress response translation initiation inhibitor YciH [Proteobacteria bacterium]|nr:stress response translation initiation inhibitor YciH [Pseudomonadota bacterium]
MKPKATFRGVVLHSTAPVQPRPAATAPPAGPPRVRVGREVAGRGGKGVSVISGLPLSAAALEELATRLKKLCGAGGAVRGAVIEIQGEHRDRLVAELTRLGYPARRSGG